MQADTPFQLRGTSSCWRKQILAPHQVPGPTDNRHPSDKWAHAGAVLAGWLLCKIAFGWANFMHNINFGLGVNKKIGMVLQSCSTLGLVLAKCSIRYCFILRSIIKFWSESDQRQRILNIWRTTSWEMGKRRPVQSSVFFLSLCRFWCFWSITLLQLFTYLPWAALAFPCLRSPSLVCFRVCTIDQIECQVQWIFDWKRSAFIPPFLGAIKSPITQGKQALGFLFHLSLF